MKGNSCKYYKSRDLITQPWPLKLNIPNYCSSHTTTMKQKQCLRRYRQQQNTERDNAYSLYS